MLLPTMVDGEGEIGLVSRIHFQGKLFLKNWTSTNPVVSQLISASAPGEVLVRPKTSPYERYRLLTISEQKHTL